MRKGRLLSHILSLRHSHNLRAVKVLLVSVFLWLIAFGYCQQRFWREPHSAFFRDSHVYDLKYSLYREREARHFISRYNAPTDPPEAVKSASDPTFCVAIVTVRRPSDDYFDPSIGSLLAGLDPRERRSLRLNILFTDTEPTRHPGWGQKWVERLADEVSTYNVSSDQLQSLRQWEKERDFHIKGVFGLSDYIYALKSCEASNAPYIAIFEDDIIVADGWLAKTLKGLNDIDRVFPAKQPWLYLRLFYTETALSWSSSDFAYRNMPLIFGMVILFVFTGLTLARRVGPCHSHLDNATIGVLSAVCAPAFLALIYMTGKYSLAPLRGVVDIGRSGCCTQGLVFPRQQVPGVVEYLRQEKRGQTDTMIENYAEKTGLKRYALAPQQLQHVGLQSSRDNTEVNTQSNWAFYFEENDPNVLKKEHSDLLNDQEIKSLLDKYS
ncbi:conserved hypothetical protein [Uncinocarpus reesii 1704]|uniref:Integral membrane protein n=1 Tax=Uncinocarpus reesii (strain UAMH 1704) TaxID=336963 RepID=C4JJM8_UNCRE|nr:uncharacterized protein UREG_01835 [Uncinocarpus reesii 1704]EEP76986.1 conserved hypothetical protein [Uncinocarpus reesii 1704]